MSLDRINPFGASPSTAQLFTTGELPLDPAYASGEKFNAQMLSAPAPRDAAQGPLILAEANTAGAPSPAGPPGALVPVGEAQRRHQDRRQIPRMDYDPRRQIDWGPQLRLQTQTPEVSLHYNTWSPVNRMHLDSQRLGTPPPVLFNIGTVVSTKEVNGASSPGVVDVHILHWLKDTIDDAVFGAFEQVFAEITAEQRDQTNALVQHYDVAAYQPDAETPSTPRVAASLTQTDNEFRTLSYVTNLPHAARERMLELAGEKVQQAISAHLPELERRAQAGELGTVRANFMEKVRAFFGVDTGRAFTHASGPPVTQALQTPAQTIALRWAADHSLNWDQIPGYALDARAAVKGFVDTVSTVALAPNASAYLPSGYQATRAELVLSVDGVDYALAEPLDGLNTLAIPLSVELRKKAIDPQTQNVQVKVRVHGHKTGDSNAETFETVPAGQYYAQLDQRAPFSSGVGLYQAFADTTKIVGNTDILNTITVARMREAEQTQQKTGESYYQRISRILFAIGFGDDAQGNPLLPLSREDKQFIRDNALSIVPRVGGATEGIFVTALANLHRRRDIDSITTINIDLKNIGALNMAYQARALIHDIHPMQNGQQMAETLATGQDAVTQMKADFMEIFRTSASEIIAADLAQYTRLDQNQVGDLWERPSYLVELLAELEDGRLPAIRIGGDEIVIALGNVQGDAQGAENLAQRFVRASLPRAEEQGIHVRLGLVDMAKQENFSRETVNLLTQSLLNFSDELLNQKVKPIEALERRLANAFNTIPPHAHAEAFLGPPIVPAIIPRIAENNRPSYEGFDGSHINPAQIREDTEARLQLVEGYLILRQGLKNLSPRQLIHQPWVRELTQALGAQGLMNFILGNGDDTHNGDIDEGPTSGTSPVPKKPPDDPAPPGETAATAEASEAPSPQGQQDMTAGEHRQGLEDLKQQMPLAATQWLRYTSRALSSTAAQARGDAEQARRQLDNVLAGAKRQLVGIEQDSASVQQRLHRISANAGAPIIDNPQNSPDALAAKTSAPLFKVTQNSEAVSVPTTVPDVRDATGASTPTSVTRSPQQTLLTIDLGNLAPRNWLDRQATTLVNRLLDGDNTTLIPRNKPLRELAEQGKVVYQNQVVDLTQAGFVYLEDLNQLQFPNNGLAGGLFAAMQIVDNELGHSNRDRNGLFKAPEGANQEFIDEYRRVINHQALRDAALNALGALIGIRASMTSVGVSGGKPAVPAKSTVRVAPVPQPAATPNINATSSPATPSQQNVKPTVTPPPGGFRLEDYSSTSRMETQPVLLQPLPQRQGLRK